MAVLASGVAAPEPSQAVGAFVSDHFTGAALGSQWEPVTPREAGSVQLTGSSRAGGLLALSVPAGVNHDPWRANDAVRAVQSVRDEDLSVEARFKSVPFARYQMQGLILARAATTFLRYGVHHDGSGLRLFVSTTVDGSPTVVADEELPELDEVYLRVARTGHRWTLSWSADGLAWSVGAEFVHPTVVFEIGPFAGNYDAAGNPPAFTALVDYLVDTGDPDPPVVGMGASADADADASPPAVATVAADTRPRSSRLSWLTDEVTTGVVVYGTTDAYGEASAVTAAGLGHEVVLRNLEPATSYHFRVTATDLSGNVTTIEDAVFTTDDAGEGAPFVSDEFSGTRLAPHWRVVTPLGVGGLARPGPEEPADRVVLSVPAGHNHHPWVANDALRVVQPVTDGDLGIEARFTSMPTRRNQMQGLSVGGSRVTFLRYGVHHDGSGLRLFASVTVGGTPTVVVNTGLPPLEEVSLRLTRRSDDWTLSWSTESGPWTTAAEFTQRMVVAEAGPFAGSHGEDGRAPGYAAVVDYVRNTAEPDRPDGTGPGPLQVGDVSVDTSTNNVVMRWVTSTTATARVEYGTDTSYGTTSDATTPATRHSLLLPDLSLGTTYHYRIVATGSAGATVRSEDATFTTAATNTGPTIDVWYGAEQSFGPPTRGQEWVNVLGNVSDADGVASLTYSLNGGTPQGLGIGPDDRRLQWPGDFNADLPVDALRPGDNVVTFTASDALGLVTTSTVRLRWRSGAGTALPYGLQWRTDAPVSAQAQLVDGRWTVNDDGLRTDLTGYDRLAAVGDVGWSDYELTVPVTVHELGPAAYTYLSGGPMIGVGLRWNGHTAVDDDSQPAWGWYPTGAFAWYRFHETGARFELSGNEGEPDQQASLHFEIGRTYVLKVRVETAPGGTRYQARLWPADGVEPSFWLLEIEDTDGPDSGAVALIAHQLVGTFGDVTVQPL